MDNNNEYKRDFGGLSGVSSYDELPKTDDYGSLSQYESPATSDLGGYYTASYHGEAKPADEPAKSNDLNGGMSQSDYQALYSDYNGSQTENYRTSPYSAAVTG